MLVNLTNNATQRQDNTDVGQITGDHSFSLFAPRNVFNHIRCSRCAMLATGVVHKSKYENVRAYAVDSNNTPLYVTSTKLLASMKGTHHR